jgi:hypothetical protein
MPFALKIITTIRLPTNALIKKQTKDAIVLLSCFKK